MAGAARGPIAVLDVGSARLSCLVAEPRASGGFDILGTACQSSSGIRAGAVARMDAAAEAIAATLQEAEDNAGVRVRRVLVAGTGGQHRTNLVSVTLDIPHREVISGDLRQILRKATLPRREGAPRDILHKIPLGYRLDESTATVMNPAGMQAARLSTDVMLVSAPAATVRNLAGCVRRCHVLPAGIMNAAFVTGLACLSAEEQQMGAVLLDMGADTTGISVFAGGHLRWLGEVPVGGQHITADIAHGLGVSLQEAERLKILRGLTSSGLHESLGQNGNLALQRQRVSLPEIIRARLEEIFELVQKRLPENLLNTQRYVLAGGGSQLAGLPDLASRLLGVPVRAGKPVIPPGLPAECQGPAFATCIGVLRHLELYPAIDPVQERRANQVPTTKWGKMIYWFRENF